PAARRAIAHTFTTLGGGVAFVWDHHIVTCVLPTGPVRTIVWNDINGLDAKYL
ncbi:hypothetical protein LCGC14_2259750, partial [marine sediment metagenome]